MKKVFLITFLFLAVIFKAQSVKTTTFVVKGNCNDCKERIENAADIKGVKLLKWDSDSQVATVTYDESKTSLLKIQEAIASAGYDAGEVKGNDKAYWKLPKCCQYRTNKCEK